jgi:PTH2 family peptidyl-tRNA hydrolase
MIKQVIAMRRDLHMRRGKEMAQASHASMKIFLDRMTFCFDRLDPITASVYELEVTPEMKSWIEGLFTKIVVGVGSLDELMEIHDKAIQAKLPVCLIEDSGATEFHGVATYTCLAIGPADADTIDAITGHLKLL